MEGLCVYVDGDSLPVAIRSVVVRRVLKEGLPAVFVADRQLKDVLRAGEEETARLRKEAREKGVTDKAALHALRSSLRTLVVPSRDQSADDALVELCRAPALAITHDIPLAARLIAKGAVVLDDRGHVFDASNIAPRLSERAVNMTMREWGVQAERTGRMDARQLKAFSDAFDCTLSALRRTVQQKEE